MIWVVHLQVAGHFSLTSGWLQLNNIFRFLQFPKKSWCLQGLAEIQERETKPWNFSWKTSPGLNTSLFSKNFIFQVYIVLVRLLCCKKMLEYYRKGNAGRKAVSYSPHLLLHLYSLHIEVCRTQGPVHIFTYIQMYEPWQSFPALRCRCTLRHFILSFPEEGSRRLTVW